MPNVLGEMYLYGKETDRDARLEFVVEKTAEFETKTNALKELLGEFGGPVEKEEAIGEVPAADADARFTGESGSDMPFGTGEGRTDFRVGDLNCDGFDDLVLGAYNHDVGPLEQAGAVFIYFGGDRAPAEP